MNFEQLGDERSQSKLMLAQLRYNSAQNLFVCSVFAAFFSRVSPTSWLWVWWSAFVAVVGIRVLVLRRIERATPEVQQRSAAVIYSVIAITSCVWGIAPLACGVNASELSYVVAVSWVTVLVIGGTNAFQDDWIATAALAVPATFPSIVLLALEGSARSFAVIAAFGLLYSHLIVSCIRASRTRAIEDGLKRENAKLIAEYERQVQRASEELDRRLDIERELREARNKAEELSSTDALTKIANRRQFDERLEDEFSRALRLSKPVSVILMDVDLFKQYNDLYGHSAGDDCLAVIGSVLKRFARRPGDLAARYGGEEFTILLANTDARTAATIAEEVRVAVEATAIVHADSDVAPVITASFGVATVVPSAEHTPRTLVEAADKALYRAKNGGRNRVESSD